MYTGPDEPGEQQYQLTGLAGESTQRVKIVILLNLWDDPVTKEELQNLPAFSRFKGGNQGTNFTATKEQFEMHRTISTVRRTSERSSSTGSIHPVVQASQLDRRFSGPDRWQLTSLITIPGSLDSIYRLRLPLDTHLVRERQRVKRNLEYDPLLRDTAIKDVVFANRGRNTVVGIGIVNGPYKYRDNSLYNRHYRSVNWLTDKPWQYTPNLFSGKQNLFRVDTFAPTLAGPQIIRAYLNQYPEYRSD